MQWYRSEMGQAAGPLAYEELQAQAAAGRLMASDMVWSPGFASWVPAAEIPGLIPKRAPTTPVVALAPPPPPPPPPAAVAAAAPPPPRVDIAATLPPASKGEAAVPKRESAGPRLAHAQSWPPPPPAKGTPMPPSRKLATPVDPAAVAAAARARLIGAPRPAAWPATPPTRSLPPPPQDATGQHERA